MTSDYVPHQVALVAMEQPLSFSAEHIRHEKLKVLHACRPLRPEDVITGQYADCLWLPWIGTDCHKLPWVATDGLSH